LENEYPDALGFSLLPPSYVKALRKTRMINRSMPISGRMKNSVFSVFLNTASINPLFLYRVTKHSYIGRPLENQVFILHNPRVFDSYIFTFPERKSKPGIIMDETAYHSDLIAISALHTDRSGT
tara:strand:- start:44 stop:415 length:372 start_codon:yes stop_codon:yes gene_type:complete